ncbi:MAG: threonine synthase [Candidatus Diapherotrites archaeon]|jgi:threonine synthase|uniref:Threonine synthase n=1 Tax=Candidatus Iainarchaeum sp. TaxID=3101447 RepID=A0A8T5GEX5_9ARCH|nr:threonine synthase [Candidatus Diapherotrites archaeon]MBT7241184.1 threonine synthase [Candidatus Diapherotrites archaeon]
MVLFYSTNSCDGEKVNFEQALLRGLAPDYGLYMVGRSEIPKFSQEELQEMKGKSYSQIAYNVLSKFLIDEIPEADLKSLLDDAYDEEIIPTEVQQISDTIRIMWLTKGPTYSFKDYAARFFGRTLNYFLKKRGLRRVVVVATSGDTGGAVADALHGLDSVDNIVFFPKGAVSEGQRKQMTTLRDNVYAFEVNGDFDVCQSLAKNLLGDKEFVGEVFEDEQRLTSANSISVGRLLPQAVYPFYAYSKVGEEFVASIPSGNFGDMMGTVVAKEMGLPVKKIICGVNENREFPDFLKTGEYIVNPSIKSPSSAMIVSHPSNLARLIDFYDGHMYDERDAGTKKVTNPGMIDKMPNVEAMKEDIYSMSIDNDTHYSTMKKAYDEFGVVLDPHGSVGWKALEIYHSKTENANEIGVIYETADPGKFPVDVEKAIMQVPMVPKRMQEQKGAEERIFSIENKSDKTAQGLKLSDSQISEAKQKIKELFA